MVIIVYAKLSTKMRKVLKTKGCLPPQMPSVTSRWVYHTGGCEYRGKKWKAMWRKWV